ncbi:MAG: isopeptide-forming domain-containing fimbrial protein [Lachnospiraceae bacterium]|nr:isopeptide-forming domain-containing fimbrial protein [Lachnospiraceae bacterium]
MRNTTMRNAITKLARTLAVSTLTAATILTFAAGAVSADTAGTAGETTGAEASTTGTAGSPGTTGSTGTAGSPTTGTPYTITIENPNGPGHTYEAYQIFSGTTSSDTSGLAQVRWGSGVDSEALTDALADDTETSGAFSGCSSAPDYAAKLAADTTNTTLSEAFARIAGSHLTSPAGTSTEEASPYTIALHASGYYLVKDKDASLDGTSGTAYTPYLMAVAGNATLHAKEKIPTVEKKVKSGIKWQDAADATLGDKIQMKLTGTTSNYTSAFKTYAYTFTDTSNAGLAADKDSVKVYENEVSDANLIKSGYTTTYDASRHILTISFEDLKASVKNLSANTKIIVTYDASLTEDAVVTEEGNPNKCYVTYSNNPYGAGTGKTAEDKITVFTFKLTLEKLGADGKALKGAGFTISRRDGDTWTAVGDEKKNTEGNAFDFTGLGNGVYRLVESTAPDGYETIKPVIFKITSSYETESEDPRLTSFDIVNEDGSAFSNTAVTLTIPSTGTAHMAITDNPGSPLPETGGTGRDRAVIVLGLGMLAAAMILALRSRKSE